MNALIQNALVVPKKRKATKPSFASKLKRLETKGKISSKKQDRKKTSTYD
jgi:ribosome-associated protein